MPPLILLQTIEAVTRLGSFKHAAEELLVTPSAISHRVRSVEHALGFPLFERVGQGIQPTESAKALADAVSAARSQIARAWNDVLEDTEARALKMCCMASFGSHFLLPNIASFRRKFASIELEFTNLRYSETLGTRSHDLVVGIGDRPGADWLCEDILDLEMYPIASQHDREAAVRDDTLFGPLIGYSMGQLSWREIAADLGLRLDPEAKILTFDSMISACEAAEHGLGVALAPTFVARRMQRRGNVQILGERPIRTELSYWFAVKKKKAQLPIVAKFRNWLLHQIDGQGAAADVRAA